MFAMLADVFFFITILICGNASLWSGFVPSVMASIGSIFALNIGLFNIFNISFLPNFFVNERFYQMVHSLKRVNDYTFWYYLVIFVIFRSCFYWVGKNIEKLLSIMPFWKVMSKLLGFVFGVLKGIFYSVVIFATMKYFDFYYDFCSNSYIFDLLKGYFEVVFPYYEKIFRLIGL